MCTHSLSITRRTTGLWTASSILESALGLLTDLRCSPSPPLEERDGERRPIEIQRCQHTSTLLPETSRESNRYAPLAVFRNSGFGPLSAFGFLLFSPLLSGNLKIRISSSSSLSLLSVSQSRTRRLPIGHPGYSLRTIQVHSDIGAVGFKGLASQLLPLAQKQ
jgi:hypothetical protein